MSTNDNIKDMIESYNMSKRSINYYQDLTKIYKVHIGCDIAENTKGTDIIMAYLEKIENDPILIQYIVDFISDHKYIIKNITSQKNKFPYNNPVVLLLYYMMFTKTHSLIQGYPFNARADLQDIATDVGVSLCSFNLFS